MQCLTPVCSLQIKDYSNCTKQRPVVVDGASDEIRFMDPVDVTLSKIPSVVPCDPLQPVMYKVSSYLFS